MTVHKWRVAAFTLAALGLAAAGAAQDDRDRTPGNQLQSGIALSRSSATLRLPAPPATSPSAAELVRMTREERVRALNARTWEIHAERVREPIEVDGWLDEAAWERARPIGDFYEQQTDEGLPSTEKTIVRVIYDDENLYFGFFCTVGEHMDEGHASPHAERRAEESRPRTMFRDENIGSDDAVAIMLDAFNDQRSAVFLATNANGILFDMSQNGQGPANPEPQLGHGLGVSRTAGSGRLDRRGPDSVQVTPFRKAAVGSAGGIRRRFQTEHPHEDRGGVLAVRLQ